MIVVIKGEMLYILFRLWDFCKYVILIFKESDRGSNPKYIACIGNDGSYCNVAIIGFFPQVCQEEELVCRFVIMEYLAVIGVGEQLWIAISQLYEYKICGSAGKFIIAAVVFSHS